jgi:ferrous iron transport protein A
MMSPQLCLTDLQPGQRATVTALRTTGSMRRRLLDIGLITHTQVECVGKSPWGDPSAFLIRGAVIAIRAQDGRDILVTPLEEGAGTWD